MNIRLKTLSLKILSLKTLSLKTLSFTALCLALSLLVACDQLNQPFIITFEATPSSIAAGDTSTLSWNVIGGSDTVTVTLTPGDVPLEKIGTYQVTPTETTLYTLSVGEVGNLVTKSVNVTVGDAPVDPGPDPVEELCQTPDERVVFKDAELERELREDIALQGVQLNPEGLTCEQMASLENVNLGFTFQGSPNPNPAITDLSGLETAVNLKSLSLADIVAPLGPVAALKNLKELSIGSNSDSLAPLAQSESIEFIWFDYWYVPADLSPLTKVTNLKRLKIEFVDYFEVDFASIGSIPNLETLELSSHPENFFTDSVVDIAGLGNATSLKSLSFGGLTLANLSAISELTELRSLSLFSGKTELSNINFVAPLTKLETLRVGSTFGGSRPGAKGLSDISVLANLTELSKLDLTENNVSNISSLANLTKLSELNLSYSNVSDISALANLTELRELDLTENNISDISVLLALPWAAEDDRASLQNNPIPAAQIEELRQKVATVNF